MNSFCLQIRLWIVFVCDLDPNLFEGDMVLNPEEINAILIGAYFNKAMPLAATKQPWPWIIPYDLYGLSIFWLFFYFSTVLLFFHVFTLFSMCFTVHGCKLLAWRLLKKLSFLRMSRAWTRLKLATF